MKPYHLRRNTYAILSALEDGRAHESGPLTVKQLAATLRKNRAYISKGLNELLQENCVLNRPSPDGTGFWALTDRGLVSLEADDFHR